MSLTIIVTKLDNTGYPVMRVSVFKRRPMFNNDLNIIETSIWTTTAVSRVRLTLIERDVMLLVEMLYVVADRIAIVSGAAQGGGLKFTDFFDTFPL